MKEIQLTRGKFTIVDDEDYDFLMQWKWCCGPEDRPMRGSRRADGGRGCTILMYRVIVSAPEGMEVDHINGDPLDNRRSNLRICTPAQNKLNKPIHSNNTSGVKGVYWNKQVGKWQAGIVAAGKRYYLGLFTDLDEAAQAYKEAAEKVHGEFQRKL